MTSFYDFCFKRKPLKNLEIQEDEGGAVGGPVAPPPATPPGAIGSDDVLGKFDKDGGCLGKGDFHVPFIMPFGSRLAPFPLKKKKRKTKKRKARKTVKESFQTNESMKWFMPKGNFDVNPRNPFGCKFPSFSSAIARKLTGLNMVEFFGERNNVRSCIGCNGGGRAYAIVEEHGIWIPFYVSSGDGDKERVPTGHWYPFFGKGEDGWLNKGTQDNILDYYGSRKLKSIAQTLDRTLKMNTLVQFDRERGTYLSGFPYCAADSGNLKKLYNRDLHPVCLGDPRWKKNINDFLMAIGEFPIYESKNKITKGARIQTQKTQSFKVTTTEKAKPVSKIPLKKDQTIPNEIENKLKKAVSSNKVIANSLRSKESRIVPKHTTTSNNIEKFKKSKIQVKKISFPKEEITSKLKDQDYLITTRVDEDFNRYQIGDIVQAPWKQNYKIIGRKVISNVIYHPFFKELTQKQIEILREYNQIAVLTLTKQESISESMQYDPPYTLEQIRSHYDEDTYNMLANDPIHRWRAVTGIELIHKEPTYQELLRIWNNWQLMSDEEKYYSNQKSIELFGVDNETHFYQLQDEYSDLDKNPVSFQQFQDWNDKIRNLND